MVSMTDSVSTTEARGQAMLRGFAGFDSIRSPGRGEMPPSAEAISAQVAGGRMSQFDSRMGGSAWSKPRLHDIEFPRRAWRLLGGSALPRRELAHWVPLVPSQPAPKPPILPL